MSDKQSATLALFVVFVLLVIFIGKSGTDVWTSLFTHYDYDIWVGPIHLIEGKNLPPGQSASGSSYIAGTTTIDKIIKPIQVNTGTDPTAVLK